MLTDDAFPRGISPDDSPLISSEINQQATIEECTR